jgi:drug/metabolite transporter (DMT)-like permease
MRGGFLVGFLALVVFDTMGQVGFKLTAEVSGVLDMSLDWARLVLAQPAFYMIVAAYILAFFTYMTLMKEAPVGPLFAAAHLELVTVTVLSWLWFGERLSLVQLLGCACIIGGVVILGVTESQDDHQQHTQDPS